MNEGRPRVLVVDDDPDLRELVRLVLVEEDLDVLEAAHGAEALTIVAQARPELVLLDMSMPVLDGWAFCVELDKLGGPRPRIVVVTAAESPAQRAKEVGADAYLAKPFDVDDLLACVRRFAPPPGATTNV